VIVRFVDICDIVVPHWLNFLFTSAYLFTPTNNGQNKSTASIYFHYYGILKVVFFVGN